MTLAQQLVADAGTFLALGDFAETVTYFPAAGKPRDIAAIAAQSTRREQETAHHSLETESLTLSVQNDPLLGVDRPQRGDALLRGSDAPNRRWAFVEVVDSDAAVTVLRFERPRIVKAGQFKPSQL